MYSKENVSRLIGSDESICNAGDFDPIGTLDKNINFINEKYNGQFNKTEVLSTSYAEGDKEFAIITCRDMTCLNENKLLMYLTTEKDAKRLMPNIQMAVNENKQLSFVEFVMCLTYHDIETERDAFGIDSNENGQMEKFKSSVTGYKHDPLYPPLPKEPHGSLSGIGFIYDEDMDERVLMAIELVKHMKNVVAVHEHQGTLAIYSKDPCEMEEIEVYGDNWSVDNYVPENGKWVEV